MPEKTLTEMLDALERGARRDELLKLLDFLGKDKFESIKFLKYIQKRISELPD